MSLKSGIVKINVRNKECDIYIIPLPDAILVPALLIWLNTADAAPLSCPFCPPVGADGGTTDGGGGGGGAPAPDGAAPGVAGGP